MHILPVQESDKIMAIRLVIDGNAVYEIDEDCLECQKKNSGFQKWMKHSESPGTQESIQNKTNEKA